jgi:hypothetical protein
LSVDVEQFAEFEGLRAVVGIGRHDVFHVRPPLLAGRGLRDGVPARFVLDLDVAEQLARLWMKKDRVVVDSVLLERIRFLALGSET